MSSSRTVVPIQVPADLLHQVLKLEGPQGADEVLHNIFELGLRVWSEEMYRVSFGSIRNLENFIQEMQKRNRQENHSG